LKFSVLIGGGFTSMSILDWVGRIHCGDAYKLLREMPSESVDCVITSPPYYGLRVYGEASYTVFNGSQNCEHEWGDAIPVKDNWRWHTLETKVYPNRVKRGESSVAKNHGSFCVKCGAWRGQLGLEPTWEMYVKHLVELFREVKRVLKKTGSLWLNIGDTYSGGRRGGGRSLPPKCLMGIPWRVALAMIDDGWILRNAVIWHKPNAMPSSVKDRLTQTYEYIFHFVKSRRYYYNLDNIREPHKTMPMQSNHTVRDVKSEVESQIHVGKSCGEVAERSSLEGVFTVPRNSKFLEVDVKTASPVARALKTLMSGKLTTHVKRGVLDVGAYLKSKLRESGLTIRQLAELTGIKQTTLEHYFRTDFSGRALPSREVWNILKPILNLGEYDDYINEEIRCALPQPHPLGRNPGDLFSIPTKPFKGAHFAVFPPELPLKPILVSCPPDGIVLDPLAGSGTVALTCEMINHGMWDEFKIPVNNIARKTKWNLKWILIEINPEYCKLAEERLKQFMKQKRLESFI